MSRRKLRLERTLVRLEEELKKGQSPESIARGVSFEQWKKEKMRVIKITEYNISNL